MDNFDYKSILVDSGTIVQCTSGLNSNNIRQSSCFITKSKRVALRADTSNHKNLVHSWEAVELEEEEVERKLFQLETSRSPTAASIRTNCDDGSRNATSRPRQTKQTRQDYLWSVSPLCASSLLPPVPRIMWWKAVRLVLDRTRTFPRCEDKKLGCIKYVL